MSYKINILLFVFLLSVFSGCATRDNADFDLFYTQVSILSEETSISIQQAQLFAELNMVEAISNGDSDLLESIVLKRTGTFVLTTDSTSIYSKLIQAEAQFSETTLLLRLYALFLAEITNYDQLDFDLFPSDVPEKQLLRAVIVSLTEFGVTEFDAKKVSLTMDEASDEILLISTSAAELIEATANAVQATYFDIATRRQIDIVTHGNPVELVEDLVFINNQTTTLLANLKILHDSWLEIPAIHAELNNSLSEETVSMTLRILIERMLLLREEEQ